MGLWLSLAQDYRLLLPLGQRLAAEIRQIFPANWEFPHFSGGFSEKIEIITINVGFFPLPPLIAGKYLGLHSSN